MPKKQEVSLRLTDRQINSILQQHDVLTLMEEFMNDSRVEKLYSELLCVFYATPRNTMPLASKKIKPQVWKTFTAFKDQFEKGMKRYFVAEILETLASVNCNINRTKKQIANKAAQLFEQYISLVYVEVSSDMNIDHVLNGNQPVEWL